MPRLLIITGLMTNDERACVAPNYENEKERTIREAIEFKMDSNHLFSALIGGLMKNYIRNFLQSLGLRAE